MLMTSRARLRQATLNPDLDFGAFLLAACDGDRLRANRMRDSLRGGLKTRKAILLACDAFKVEPSFWFLTDKDKITTVAQTVEAQ